MNRSKNIKHTVFNDLWAVKKAYKYIDGVKYKSISREEWQFTSLDKKFTSELTVIESGIILNVVLGKPSIDCIEQAVFNISRVAEMFGLQSQGCSLIVDTVKLKGRKSILLRKYKEQLSAVDLYNLVGKSSKRLMRVFNKKVAGVIVKGTLVEVISEVERKKNVKIKALKEVDLTHGVNELLNWVSNLSLNPYAEVELPKISSGDPFYEVFQALKNLNKDKQIRIESLNSTLTETKEKLDVRSANLRAIFEHSALSIGLLNDRFELIDFNRRLNDHFSKLGHMLVKGNKVTEYLTEEEKQIFLKNQLEVKKGKSTEVENKVTYRDGTQRWFKTKVFPVYLDEDKIYSAFVSEDVTAEYLLRNEQKKILKNVKDQNDVLKSLNHKVAHELNHHAASITQLLSHYTDKDLSLDNKVDFVLNLQGLLGKLNGSIEDINEVTHASGNKDYISKIILTDDKEAKKRLANIMLVDDDNITNVMNEHLLKKKINNCVVSKYLKGQEALKALIDQQGDTPDIVLLDINMPDIDGWAFLEVLMKSNIDVEVHMLTSSKNPEEKVKAMNYPLVKSFLNKPLDAQKIERLAG